MRLFNLSVVLPQLLVSLVMSLFINRVADKSLVFQVSAISLRLSALAWMLVSDKAKNSPTME